MFGGDGPHNNDSIVDSLDGEGREKEFEDPLSDIDLAIGDFGLPEAGTGDRKEVEDVDDDGNLCGCDPEYKHPETVLKERGASIGAGIGSIGGQYAEETTVIICTDCGNRFYEDESHSNSGGLGLSL